MNTLKVLLIVTLPVFFAGCASTHRPADPARQQQEAEAAVLLGSVTYDSSARVGFASGDQRNVNGDAVYPPIWGRLRILPGELRVTVFLGNQSFRAAEVVDLAVEAGHVYHFTAKRDGLTFVLRVWDETDGTKGRTLVKESRIVGDTPSLVGTADGRYVRP